MVQLVHPTLRPGDEPDTIELNRKVCQDNIFRIP